MRGSQSYLDLVIVRFCARKNLTNPSLVFSELSGPAATVVSLTLAAFHVSTLLVIQAGLTKVLRNRLWRHFPIVPTRTEAV